MIVNKSRRAAADLRAIWTYISEADEGAADRVLDALEAKLAVLAGSPRIGSPQPDLGARVRSFVVDRHVIYYRPIRGGIHVVRLIHGARDVRGLFRR